MRDLAFVHVDTNGPEPGYHRIHWIGVVRCRAEDLKEVDRRSIGVGWRLPYWPEDADELYQEEDPYLSRNSLPGLNRILNGCVLAGFQPGRHRAFLEAAYQIEGAPFPDVDEGAIDLQSFAWPLVHQGVLAEPSLDALADKLDVRVDTSMGRFAVEKAELAYRTYSVLTQRIPFQTLVHLAACEGDEATIVAELSRRLHRARAEYGPWSLEDDERDYPTEALEEVFDALNYCAAALVRRSQDR